MNTIFIPVVLKNELIIVLNQKSVQDKNDFCLYLFICIDKQ